MWSTVLDGTKGFEEREKERTRQRELKKQELVQEEDSNEQFHKKLKEKDDQSTTVDYSSYLRAGTYYCGDDILTQQTITVNKKKHTMSYSSSPISSYLAFGTYDMKYDQIILISDDTKEKYLMTIRRDGTIEYNGNIFQYKEY